MADLKQHLSQPLHEKWQWILQWKVTICSSIKQNKREAAEANPRNMAVFWKEQNN